MNTNPYKSLKSGSDIRGTACEGVPGECVELTDKAVFDLTVGFCRWLSRDAGIENGRIAVESKNRLFPLWVSSDLKYTTAATHQLPLCL